MYDPPSPLFLLSGNSLLRSTFLCWFGSGWRGFWVAFAVWGSFRVPMCDPPSPLRCSLLYGDSAAWGRVFSRNGPCFRLESFMSGVFLRFVSLNGASYYADAMTALPYLIICEFKLYEHGLQWFFQSQTRFGDKILPLHTPYDVRVRAPKKDAL
jgi:hypothetical protein